MHSRAWSPFVSFGDVCHVCEWGITISSSGRSFFLLCVFRVRVMCWDVDLPSHSLRIRKGEAHCCVCHINLPSGMCHLFHSLNHRSLKRKDCHSCVFACIFNRLEKVWPYTSHAPSDGYNPPLLISHFAPIYVMESISVIRSKTVISQITAYYKTLRY